MPQASNTVTEVTRVNNAENLRTWLRTCPTVAATNRFGADYMGENAVEYGVFSVPSSYKFTENILGEQYPSFRQEQNFVFASKNPYGSDSTQNLENLAFWQDIVKWIWQQNRSGNFPAWDDGKVVAIMPTITGAMISAGSNVARYQIQLRVTYELDAVAT